MPCPSLKYFEFIHSGYNDLPDNCGQKYREDYDFLNDVLDG